MSNSLNQRVSRLLVLFVLPVSSLMGCDFEAGVGDPAEAKVDHELAGYWVAELERKVWVIKATPDKEGKIYAVEYLECTGTLKAPKARVARVLCNAWLAEIGEVQFVTVGPLAKVSGGQQREGVKPYMICQINRSDDALELTPLAHKFDAFQRVKTRAEMERAVRDNLENRSAYREAVKLKRSTADAVKNVLELSGESSR